MKTDYTSIDYIVEEKNLLDPQFYFDINHDKSTGDIKNDEKFIFDYDREYGNEVFVHGMGYTEVTLQREKNKVILNDIGNYCKNYMLNHLFVGVELFLKGTSFSNEVIATVRLLTEFISKKYDSGKMNYIGRLFMKSEFTEKDFYVIAEKMDDLDKMHNNRTTPWKTLYIFRALKTGETLWKTYFTNSSFPPLIQFHTEER